MTALIIALISLIPNLANAQELYLTQDQLQQCAAYFTQGSYPQWIAGALTVVPMIFFALTKKNLPDIFRDLGRWYMEKRAPQVPEVKRDPHD